MTRCNIDDHEVLLDQTTNKNQGCKDLQSLITRNCPSCGHQIKCQDQIMGKGPDDQLSWEAVPLLGAGIHHLPGLPAGVKFDPTDQELLEHLEGKVMRCETSSGNKVHPLIDEFIPTLKGENGICYTHPKKLPGVSKDGLIRHFFHRPSKAYTTGNRKRRKVHTDTDGGETRWHKTGKTRPVFVSGRVKGYKKILVLYTNYGKQRKPEKTNWVMHQYHLGSSEEEKDGELVVSKVFYQTQPRQCGNSAMKDLMKGQNGNDSLVDYCNNPNNFISFAIGNGGQNETTTTSENIAPHFSGSFIS